MFLGCFPRLFRGCSQVILGYSRLFLSCFQVVSRLFQVILGYSRLFQVILGYFQVIYEIEKITGNNLKNNLNFFRGCFQVVSRLFPGYFQVVSRLFLGYSRLFQVILGYFQGICEPLIPVSSFITCQARMPSHSAYPRRIWPTQPIRKLRISSILTAARITQK